MTPLPPPSDRSARLNLRIVGMLMLCTLIISASVVATDLVSIRSRNPATQPAAAPQLPTKAP